MQVCKSSQAELCSARFAGAPLMPRGQQRRHNRQHPELERRDMAGQRMLYRRLPKEYHNRCLLIHSAN